MNGILQEVVGHYKNDTGIQSIAAVENPAAFPFLIESCDILVLLVSHSDGLQNHTTHYIKDGYTIQERRVSPAYLERALIVAERPGIVQWILLGEIMLDREGFLHDLRSRLSEFSLVDQESKLLKEFAQFTSHFSDCKEYMQEGRLLDAYSHILAALQHWARIAVIEAGRYPELTVWSQVHHINPGVYKLYEELAYSQETLEQRIQLVLLGCEFSVMSKMEKCSQALLAVISKRQEPWSIKELQKHECLRGVAHQLPQLLRRLARKSLVREVAVPVTGDFDLLELRYTV